MPEQYSITQYIEDLRSITENTIDENEILEKVGLNAKRLSAESDWIEDRFYNPDEETGFSAFLLHEEEDHSLAVLAVSWAPGMGVGPHDHGTWVWLPGSMASNAIPDTSASMTGVILSMQSWKLKTSQMQAPENWCVSETVAFMRCITIAIK